MKNINKPPTVAADVGIDDFIDCYNIDSRE